MAQEILLQNKFFTADRIDNGLTRIMGMGKELCYLIEGTERALLIDGLSGIGSLKGFVRELTDLPVIMATTHGHLDHVGAAWEYDELYINPDDIALMYTDMHSSREGRLNFVKIFTLFGVKLRTEPVESDAIEAHNIKTYPFYDGDVFDLGDKKIEAIAVPGHTYGTMVFLDRERRIVFSGDACNANTLLDLVGSTSIEEYLLSLQHFKTYQKDFDILYGGHGLEAMPNTTIDDAITLCNKILDGTDDAVPAKDYYGGESLSAAERGDNNLFKYGGMCNILYKKDTIHKREHPVIKDQPNYYR